MLTATLLLALSTAGWALWIRRDCWHSHWERAGNAFIALQTAALILAAPHAETLSTVGQQLTGLEDVEDFASHCLFIWATVAFAHHIGTRLTGVAPNVQRLLWAIMLPTTIIRFILFATHQYALYWIVVSGSIITILGWTAHVMVTELWGEPKHRPAIVVYLIAAAIGAATSILRIVEALNGRTNIDMDTTIWLGCAAATIGWTLGFGYSWRRRQHLIRGAVPAY